MAFILFFLQIIRRSGLSACTRMILLGYSLRLWIIVFERSLFNFIYILRIGFVEGLSFHNNDN